MHGDCVGGDAQLATMAESLGFKSNEVHKYPRVPKDQRAWAFGMLVTVKDPNRSCRRMVRRADLILAFAGMGPELLRSATLTAIRYARHLKKHLIVVYPDGRQEETNR